MLAVVVLEECFVGCGQVDYDVRSGNGGIGARLHRHPQILTDLYSDYRFSNREQLPGTQPCSLAGINYFFIYRGTALEPADFIELGMIRQIGLGYNAKYLAPLDQDGAVV